MMACCGPSEVARGWRRERDSLRAENARLQERVREAEKERDWLMRMPLNERIDALVVELDRYKVQSERRREALEPEHLAQAFHEAYEELAPQFGYKTREASAVPWADVPENNKALMIATCERVARAAIDISPEEAREKKL